MAYKRKEFKAWVAFLLAVVCFVVGVAVGFVGAAYIAYKKEKSDVFFDGDLQIHFLELGNKYTGDCTYIKAGNTDILIDAGSRVESIPTIREYVDQYCEDGVLEYVIVTHAHQDHYAGFATNEDTQSLFDIYDVEVIIDFALTNQADDAKMYNNYLREREEEINDGATHYTAAECIQGDKNIFKIATGMTLTVLDSFYYYNESSSENDYSVCCLLTQGENNYLFTGDLEERGEKKLVEMNDLPEVELYKAGHHGSKTSSCPELLEVIKPKRVAVCCCAGSPEYTSTAQNQFPTQTFIDNVAPYTTEVYVTTLCIDYKAGQFTSMNGNIVIIAGISGIRVDCSNNNTPLKDTDWFKENRICPDAWK